METGIAALILTLNNYMMMMNILNYFGITGNPGEMILLLFPSGGRKEKLRLGCFARNIHLIRQLTLRELCRG